MVTRVLIPREAVKGHLDKLRAVTAPNTCQDSVTTKIMALNRIIGGWCRYYQYTARAAATFSQVSHRMWWFMAHWLGRKFRSKISGMRARFGRGNTFATDKHTLCLHDEYPRQIYKDTFHKPNPYTMKVRIEREDRPGDTFWTGFEERPGHADLRLQAFARDGYACTFCKKPVTDETGQAHHLRPVRWFKRPVDANFIGNYTTTCIDCHRELTENERQRESRVR
jgi:hypothetical protein